MHSIFQPGVSAWNNPKKVAKSQHPRKWQSSHITPTVWECRLVQVFEILSLSFIRRLWHNFLEVAWWNFSGTVREVFQKATSDSQAQRRWCCHSYGWMLWMSVKMLPWPSPYCSCLDQWSKPRNHQLPAKSIERTKTQSSIRNQQTPKISSNLS